VKSPPAPNGTQNHCASSPCVPGVRRFSLILLRFRGGVARALRRLVGWRVEGSGERAGGWLAAETRHRGAAFLFQRGWTDRRLDV
jgi:hypothetical protein